MDVNILSDVLGGNEYALEQLQLPTHATIVDLGGNIGTFAMEMHRMFPTAHITSYEPHPGNCAMFAMNAPSAHLVPKAAAGHTGTVHLEDSGNYVGLQVIAEGGIEVAAESLDDILKDFKKIDLLKIDIEGSEYPVLNNASEKTFTKIERILMETHDIPGFDDLAWAENILTRQGFKISWIDRKGIIYGER
jgi:FkbM family methyltransferase